MGGGDDNGAERAFGTTVVDGQLLSAVLEFARRHAFYFYKQVMQPAGTRKARLKSRINQGNGSTFFQYLFGMFQGQVLQELFGGNAGPVLKHPLKMKGANMYMLGHHL